MFEAFAVDREEINPTTQLYVEATIDTFSNTRGGRDRSNTSLYLLSLGAQTQLSDSLTVNAGLMLTDNQSISAIVGDDQALSNIEAESAGLRVGELTLSYASNNWLVLVGVYDINNDFDYLDSASLFVNSAFGLGSDFGMSGANGPSTYPTPGLLAQFSYTWGAHRFKFAMADGEPGDANNVKSQSLKLNADWLYVSEYSYHADNGRLLIGAWRYNNTDEPLSDNGIADGDQNVGFYLRGETPSLAISSSLSITAFARVGVASANYNLYDRFYSCGVVVQTDWFSRQDDKLGIAVAHAQASQFYQQPNDDHERVWEVSYLTALSANVSLQPNFQYIESPGGNGNLDNALVIGVRFGFTL